MAKITKIKDNIITVKGTENYQIFQYFKLGKNVDGFVLSAENGEAKLVGMGDITSLKVGATATQIKGTSDIVANEDMYGKIISPSGKVIHEDLDIKYNKSKVIGKSQLFREAPSIIDRVPLKKPLETGMITIDSMIPVGRGQRELIIGDRNTGKSFIGINTIINNKKDVKSIYIAIGQKRSNITSTFNTLRENDAIKNSIIIYANTDNPGEQLLAPMMGMAIAEAISYSGEDVLVVIDDLSKHANVYREVSLSIERNPGREAYPNDIFYMHSRLLERGGSFGKKYNNGTITILPIVETVEDDIASLIPSNVISITDGQIFTSFEEFNKGNYPAINIQKSVSRTGSAVQSDALASASKGLKGNHAQFEEIKKFAQMSIDVSDELSLKIKKSREFQKLLIQFGNKGYSRVEQIILINLYKSNLFDEKLDIRQLQESLMGFMKKDPVGKKLFQLIKDNKLSRDETNLYIEAAISPLVKASMGVWEQSGVSKDEFELLKGGK